ncbi:MAG TPA: hypothetical protein VNO79_10680 [Actinomycetota bacterium]|nr:hypothetical protein [Actinomycetota bacterium]
MAIAFTNLGASADPDINSSADAASYSSVSWTPPASGLIFLFVYNRKVGGGDIPTVSGNGITWVQIATILADPHRLTLFGANAAGSTAGQTTIDFGGVTQLGCIAMFAHADGTDVVNGVAQTFVQAPTGSGTGTSGSITLAGASGADNRPIAAFVHAANEAVTPRTGWTEFDEFTGVGPPRGADSQVRSDAFETTASASWATSAAWVGIAAELKAAGAAAASLVVARDRRTRHLLVL